VPEGSRVVIADAELAPFETAAREDDQYGPPKSR